MGKTKFGFCIRRESIAKARLRLMVLVHAAYRIFVLFLDRIDFTPYVEVSKLDYIAAITNTPYSGEPIRSAPLGETLLRTSFNVDESIKEMIPLIEEGY